MSTRPSTDHQTHDPLPIAAWVAGDADATGRRIAAELEAGCAECAQLAADLRTLATAIHDLPRPARPRDFTLTAADAERARRPGWRSLLAAFAGPRFDLVRPLAAGMTTLGVAGFLLASTPAVLPGGGGTAEERLVVEASGTPSYGQYAPAGGEAPRSPVPVVDAAAPSPGSLAGDGGDAADPDLGDDRDAAPRDPRAASPLGVLSGSFLIVGLGLFGLRWTARRLGDG